MKRKQVYGNKNLVGGRVKQIRKSKGLSQMQVMAQLQINGFDIDGTGLSKVEHRNRNVSDNELVILADTLHVSTDWLLGREEKSRLVTPNEPLTLEQLRKMNDERVWTQFHRLGMYGLVAYHSDPDGDDGDDVYITNNLGGRSTYEEILSQGGTVYARKPEGSDSH